MNTMRKTSLLVAGFVGALAVQGTALAQFARFDELANLPFAEGRPTKETAQTLRD